MEKYGKRDQIIPNPCENHSKRLQTAHVDGPGALQEQVPNEGALPVESSSHFAGGKEPRDHIPILTFHPREVVQMLENH